MLVPQPVELCVEPLELGPELRIMTFGEPVPDLRPRFARPVDSLVDLGEDWIRHACDNAALASEIPPSGLGVAELVEPVFVDPEVVRELVKDSDADLTLELLRVRKLLDERATV